MTFQTGDADVAGAAVAVTDTSSDAGTGWTCEYTTVAGDTAGAVSFTIDGTDLAGNALVQVVDVTDGSSMVFDDVAPTLTAVSIASNNAASSLAKVGNTVTVTIAASETIAQPTCVFAGVADSSVTYGGSGADWTCAVDVATGDTAGAVSFTIDAADPAGNALVQVVDVTDSSSVTFDETVPTLTAVSISSSNAAPNTNKNFLLHRHCLRRLRQLSCIMYHVQEKTVFEINCSSV